MDTNNSNQVKAAPATIPPHIVERLESEWRQMRQGSAQPASPSK
ncbi:hypothetical protein [Rhizobium sp. CG5]|nr:hypothetical protein [Rhizobium sp. CG5]